jgi:hypothetical protein
MKTAGVKNVLSKRQRRTCALSWADQMPQADIAAVHGVSKWAVKKRVQRARKRLRKVGIKPPGDPRSLHRRVKRAQLSLLEVYV